MDAERIGVHAQSWIRGAGGLVTPHTASMSSAAVCTTNPSTSSPGSVTFDQPSI
jgi:hypothetical protein